MMTDKKGSISLKINETVQYGSFFILPDLD